MENTNKINDAENVYNAICASLDEKKLKYQQIKEKWLILLKINGKDLPINLIIRVDIDRDVVFVDSVIDFPAPESKYPILAAAACAANSKIVDGAFCFDFKEVRMFYRITTSYRESIISKDVFSYMIVRAVVAVDKFNGIFLKISKSDMSVDEVFKVISWGN